MEHINNLESRCSAHDPTEDTESRIGRGIRIADTVVAAPTIRLRILKANSSLRFSVLSSLVAAPTIRLRILKVLDGLPLTLDGLELQRPRSD